MNAEEIRAEIARLQALLADALEGEEDEIDEIDGLERACERAFDSEFEDARSERASMWAREY